MKLFEKLDMNDLRASWAQKDNPETSFYGGAIPAFTPAIQGQDNLMNPFSGISHFAALHNVMLNWEYTGWLDECQSISTTGYIGDWSWLYKMRITGPYMLSYSICFFLNFYNNS